MSMFRWVCLYMDYLYYNEFAEKKVCWYYLLTNGLGVIHVICMHLYLNACVMN